MPYGLPQSAMYAMRGSVADGNAFRDRGREQAYSGSGNPNMPVFNTPGGVNGPPQQQIQAQRPIVPYQTGPVGQPQTMQAQLPQIPAYQGGQPGMVMQMQQPQRFANAPIPQMPFRRPSYHGPQFGYK